MSKLSVLHISLIGIGVSLLVAGVLAFTIVKSAMESKTAAEKEYETVKAEADKRPQAEAALKKAKKEKEDAERDYGRFEAQYMPVIGYTGDRLSTMQQLFWAHNGKSWPERFMRAVRSHMAAEAKSNGVQWDNPGVVMFAPQGPNPNALQAGPLSEGLGPILHYQYQIQVTAKSMDAVLRHVASWPRIRFAGVPVVEGLEVTGNSPKLSASYNLTLTIILRGTEKIPAEMPRLTGSASASQSAGGMMTGPGGMAGMGLPGGRGGMPGMMSGPGGPGGGGPMAMSPSGAAASGGAPPAGAPGGRGGAMGAN